MAMKKTVWAASLLALASSAGASLVPLDDALLLNTAIPCEQNSPDVAGLSGGGFVAIWTDNVGTTSGLLGRLLGPDGQPTSGELNLDGGSAFYFAAAVAPGAGGGFIVATTEVPDTLPPQTVVALRAYDAAGQQRAGPVAASTAGGAPDPNIIGLATDGAGRPAVAWSNGRTVFVSLFDADLTPRAGPLAVGDAEANHDVRAVAVAAKASGEILVVWEESNVFLAPSPWSTVVRARRFAPQGIPLGNSIALNETTAERLYSVAPAAAALAGGGFAVVWATGSAPGPRIVAQLLDGSGAPAGGNFAVSSLPIDAALDPDVVADPLGGFVVAWEGMLPPSSSVPFEQSDRAFARQFAADGAPLGAEVEIAVPTRDGRLESLPAVAIRDGLTVAVWLEHYPYPQVLSPPAPCPRRSTPASS